MHITKIYRIILLIYTYNNYVKNIIREYKQDHKKYNQAMIISIQNRNKIKIKIKIRYINIAEFSIHIRKRKEN